MQKVLVTGASGVLGSALVQALRDCRANVTGLSRKTTPGYDLLRPDTLQKVVGEADTLVHCASNPKRTGEDLVALKNLVRAAPGTHLVYVGIAGIEDSAKHFKYYKTKLECEEFLKSSGVPYTIVRATQFHSFVKLILGRLRLGPFLFLPKFKLQPVDVAFAAERLATHALEPPKGRAPDIHGTEVLEASALAEGLRRVKIPAFGPLKALTMLRWVKGDSGGMTWYEWLATNGGR